MNILPFVTILILVIALTISSFFGGFKESSFAKIGSTGLINAYRLARNSSEETRLENFASTLPKPAKDNTEKKPSPPKVKKNREKSFRENITDNSKFNLTPLLKEDDPFLEEVFANYLLEIYQNTHLASDYKYDKKALPKLLAKEIVQAIKKLPSATESLEFEKIILASKSLHDIWYKMLKGSPSYPNNGGWPPIGHFIVLIETKEPTVICATKASIPLLKAFFGEEITTAILTKEKEEERKREPLVKAEIVPLLEEHSFSSAKRKYITYGKAAKIRQTESEKDPISGITATVSYSTETS